MGRNNAVDAPFFVWLPAVMYVFVHSRRQPNKNTRLNRILSPHLGWLPLLGFGVFEIRLMLRFLLGCQRSCTSLYTLAASQKRKNTRLNPHSFAPFGLVAVAGFLGFRDTVDAPFFARLPAVMYAFIHSRRQPKKEKNTRLNPHSFAPFGAGCRCWVLGLLLFCRVFRIFVFGYFCFAVFVFFSSSYS